MSDPAPVRFEMVDRHVAVITLDRPEKRNAIDAAMAARLDALVKSTEADADVRAVVIAATGAVFSSGADLAAVARGEAAGLRTPDGGFAGMTMAVRTRPWIAAVAGPALAGGAEIALACDIVIAAPEASFGLPEVRRGLIAGAGGLYRMPRALPRHVATELIVTGQPIQAARAYGLGLVNRLVPADAVRATAIDIARTIAASAPVAVTESLAIARGVHDHDESALRRLSAEAATRVLATADAREGARAFVEKRAPAWRGR